MTAFPYSIRHLMYIILVKKDGSRIKYAWTQNAKDRAYAGTSTPTQSSTAHKPYTSYPDVNVGRWCQHDPTPLPCFVDPSGSGLELYICDSPGAKKGLSVYDLIIDGGAVFGNYDTRKDIEGSPFASHLESHILHPIAEVMSIRWADRGAPPLKPSFWPALTEMLRQAAKDREEAFKVMVCCQGGHGRSGSSMVALMMCMTSYSALEAISHLRAIHCARAIESKVQHEYLNLLATHLNRKADALEAEAVKDFKAHFLTLTNPFAAPYQKRLKGD